MNNDPHKVNTFSSAGHVFLTLTKTNGLSSVTQSFGFYPINGLWSLTGFSVSSKVVNDEAHEYNASLTMRVNETDFLSVIGYAQIVAPSYYDINGFNCAYFALSSFNTVRNNPLLVDDTRSNTGAYFGKTPIGIYQRLQYMKLHNDPDKNNIQIGTFYSPQSHGPCN